MRLGLLLATVLSAGAWSCGAGASVTRDRATGIELRLLPAGEFLMGTPDGEHGREPQETLSLSFRVARTAG